MESALPEHHSLLQSASNTFCSVLHCSKNMSAADNLTICSRYVLKGPNFCEKHIDVVEFRFEESAFEWGLPKLKGTGEMPAISYEFSGPSFNVSEAARLNESIGREFYSAESHVIPNGSKFYFCNARVSAGFIPLSMHHAIGAKTVVRRSQRDIRRSSSDIYLIWVPVRGSVTIVQSGRSTIVEPGNVALSSSTEPLYICTSPDKDEEHLSFQVLAPSHLVTRTLLEPKRLCGISFPADHGGSRIARELFPSLYNEAEHIDRGSMEKLALSGMEAMFQTIGQQGREYCRSVSVKEIKLRRLLDYIELHYSDPELTTDKVANACGISPRYLHYLLKMQGKRFCDFLWQPRLNNAYQQLQNITLSHRTIGEIAYGSGFKSSAHFSRAFRQQFGCSPKQFRDTHMSKLQ